MLYEVITKREARYLALAARITAEVGARVVKTYYCKEHFEKVVDGRNNFV